MSRLVTTDNVRFAVLDSNTVWMFDCLLGVAEAMCLPAVTITSGSDGAHSGPDDPHHCGHALDVRSHHLSAEQKYDFVNRLERELGFRDYFCCLEDFGRPNEHFHVQVRRVPTHPSAPVPPAGPVSA